MVEDLDSWKRQLLEKIEKIEISAINAMNLYNVKACLYFQGQLDAISKIKKIVIELGKENGGE